MASFKNFVILGLFLVSMIAAESMLRTDDFDLAYLSDVEEVKVAARPFPTTSECGPNQGQKVVETAETCGKQAAPGRCCLAVVAATTPGGTDGYTVCVSSESDWVNVSAADAQSNLNNQFTGVPTTGVTYTCPAAKADPNANGSCLKAGLTIAATQADCDYSNVNYNNDRCCFIKTIAGPNPGPKCLKAPAGQSTVRGATAWWDTGDVSYTVTGAAYCGADTAVPTAGNCGAKTPTVPKDCWRDLTTKCCQVTFGTNKFCLAAGLNNAAGVPLNRHSTPADALAYFSNTYGANLDTTIAANVQCQDVGTTLENQCGLSVDGKTKWTAGQNITFVANCTSDKTDYCCWARSADKTQGRCVKGNILVKDANSTARGNATNYIEDTFSDLSDVQCSGKFVSASLAIIAVVLALF